MADEVFTLPKYADPRHYARPRDDQPQYARKHGYRLPEDDPELDALGNDLPEEVKKDIRTIRKAGSFLIGQTAPGHFWRVLKSLDGSPVPKELDGVFTGITDIQEAITNVLRNR